MNLRVLTLSAILSLASIPLASAAITVSGTYCNDAFRTLALPKAPPAAPPAPNFPAPNVWTLPAEMTAKQTAALDRLRTLESVKVSEIFPETVQLYDATKVMTSDAATTAYRKKFDEIWKTRVEAGLVPKFELSRYRKWLLNQNTNNPLAYPAVDAAEIYNKFVKNDRPLAEYFNEKFLEFVEKESGRNDFANVDEYFKQVDRNKAKYYLGQTWKGTKNIGRKLKLNVTLIPTTVVAGSILGYQTEIVNKVTGYVFGTAKDGVTNAVNSGLEQAWNAGWGFASSEELNKAFDSVNIATEALTKTPFEKFHRSEGVNAILTVRKQYEAIMPSFKDFVGTHKKDFDSSTNGYLKEMSSDSRDARNAYEEARGQLGRLQKAIDTDAERRMKMTPEELASPAAPAPRNTFEDLQRVMVLRQKMDRNEEFLGKILAKYLLYSSTRGSKNPVDEVLKLRYENLLENYLESMSLEKLQAAWLSEVNDHTSMIKSFMPNWVAPSKTIAEKAQEDKKAAEALKAAEEEAKAKAKALQAAADKKAAEKGQEAAKEISKEARKAEEEARKAEEEARKKAAEAQKSEQKAKVDPLAKPEPAADSEAAPAAPAATPPAKAGLGG